MIIGLCGYAQTGKDAAAAHLVESLGWARVAFADPLREMLYALNPLIPDFDQTTSLQSQVDLFGWEETKKEPEVRRLLQALGTEAGRNVLGDDIWVEVAAKKIRKLFPQNVVLTDVRFENEARMILGMKGRIIRIERPGVGAVNGHVSENGIPNRYISEVIVNGGGVGDLCAKIARSVSLSRKD